MTKVCIQRPNRSVKRVFRERDCGRIVAHAREDGADDTLLIAYILQAFGIRAISCAVFRILDILNTAIFVGAVVGLLKGIILVVKGVRQLSRIRSRVILSGVELLAKLIPERFLSSLAAFLIWLGAVEAAASGLIIFLTGIANNAALFLLAKGVCTAELRSFGPATGTLDIGELQPTLELAEQELADLIKQRKGQ
jgi:hypothetical protein